MISPIENFFYMSVPGQVFGDTYPKVTGTFNISCVQGSTDGTNDIPISFKVLSMVPLVIPLVPMVMPMVPLTFPVIPLVSQW